MEILKAMVNMECTYNKRIEVRAELTDSYTPWNKTTETYSHHVDSDSTKIKTYTSFTEPVIPRRSTTATSLIENEFTLHSWYDLDNKCFIKNYQFRGFKRKYIIEKEHEKKLTQVQSMKIQQCTSACDRFNDDLVENYLETELQDPLNPYDCINNTECDRNGSNSSLSNAESSTWEYYNIGIQKDSAKLDKSTQYESVQSDSGIDSMSESMQSESESLHSQSESLNSQSESLHSQLESIRSMQTLLESCKPNSIEDSLYLQQSVCITPPESNRFEMLSQYYSHKGSKPIFDDNQKEPNFSTQSEFSHFDTLEKCQYSTESISSTTKCTEESELTLPETEGKVFLSTHLESCQSDKLRRPHYLSDSEQSWSGSPRESNHPTKFETSLLKRLGEVVLVDNEMESNYLRNCLSLHGQRHSKIQAVVSDQPSDSTFKIVYETSRFSKFDTEHDVYDKPHLIRPKVFCEGVQSQINVQNKVYYWRQVMQLYFTLMTASSNVGSLKWLFQLRPVTVQALQRLQYFLNYHFTDLNEFFSCESSDSPPNAEECMSLEWMRLQTFQNYPIMAHGSPNRLAREGFYYTGQGTQTRCFSCGVTHGEWNLIDNPREVHQRISPNCPFLNGRQEGHRNIPMSPDRSADGGRADGDSIPFPSLPVAMLTGSATEGSSSVSKTKEEADRIRQHQSGSGETTTGVPSHPVEESAQSEADNRPKFPEHVTLPSRIATFSHGWPPYLDQTPQQMAEAGFFFTGSLDYTRCYQCGGGLLKWEPGENPWIEHCRWYPMCPHVLRGKGQRFVNAVLKKQAELLAVQRAESERKDKYGETTHGVPSHPVEESAQSEADNRPKFPEHVSLPSRIATFSHGWPPCLDQTPQPMAEAGFFFTGNQDYTKCYHCGGGLRNWEPEHLPWIEHCRWYPTCPHVRKVKGQSFVNDVLEMQAKSLASQKTESRMKAQYGSTSTDPLDTLAAITLLEMGYPRDTVHNSILILRRQREPSDEITALEVLDFIWKEEDIERQRQDEEASRPRHPGEPQPPELPTLMERLNLGGSPLVTQAVVPPSGSVTTTTSSLTTAATTTTSVAMAISSTLGTAVSTSTLTSAPTLSEGATSEGERQDGGQGHSDGKNGNKTTGSLQRDDYGELEEENRKLKEQTTCKICMENPVRVIFLPCCHLVCCETCAPAFRKCPICRNRIKQSVKTYL